MVVERPLEGHRDRAEDDQEDNPTAEDLPAVTHRESTPSIERTWTGADPLGNSFASTRVVDDPAEIARLLETWQIVDHPVPADAGAVEICWPPDFSGAREVYFVPRRPMRDAGRELLCSAYLGDANGGRQGAMRIPPKREPWPNQFRTPLDRLTWDERQLLLQFGIGPVPGAGAIVGRDGEADAMLEQLGYKSRDGSEAAPLPEGESVGPVRTCEPPAMPSPGPPGPGTAPPGK